MNDGRSTHLVGNVVANRCRERCVDRPADEEASRGGRHRHGRFHVVFIHGHDRRRRRRLGHHLHLAPPVVHRPRGHMGRREALHASHEGEENRKSVHGVVTQITVGMNAGGLRG